MMATASAVVADLVDIARNLKAGDGLRVPALGFQPEELVDRGYRPMEEIICQYYLRFSAHDRPSVLSRIAGILGENNISIASVIQQGRSHNGDTVPIVMQTHQAREKDLNQALQALDQLEIIAEKTAVIRMETDL